MDSSHAPRNLAMTIAIVVLAIACLSVTAAVVDDALAVSTLPAGASVSGIDLSGLSTAGATALVRAKVATPLLAPVSVDVTGTAVRLDPSEFIDVDVAAMVDEAIAPKRDRSLVQRVWARISRARLGHDVSPTVRVDRNRLADWIAQQTSVVSKPATNASVTVTGSKVVFVPEKPGASIDVTAAAASLADALQRGDKTAVMPVALVQPKVTLDKIGKTLLVSRSKRRLWLYDGAAVEATFRVAVGMPRYPTPLGQFKIVRKVKMPTWSNNGSDWAAGMPAYIGPGPNNPLGTRALYLDAPGIRIHGIPPSENWSIGSAASHGCMRMHRWDVEALYPMVPVGTRIFIVE